MKTNRVHRHNQDIFPRFFGANNNDDVCRENSTFGADSTYGSDSDYEDLLPNTFGSDPDADDAYRSGKFVPDTSQNTSAFGCVKDTFV